MRDRERWREMERLREEVERERGEVSSREGERKGRRWKEVNSDGWKGSIMERDREI